MNKTNTHSLLSSTSNPYHASGFVVHDEDWQYPALTEQYAFKKLHQNALLDMNSSYLAFPWATLIDFLNTKKNLDFAKMMRVLNKFKSALSGKSRVVTVCQHILMLKYQRLFSDLGVTDVFWSHAVKGQLSFPAHSNIKIHPFPLYPVQAVGEGCADNHKDRSYLFSFVGARAKQWYLTQSRSIILKELSADKRGVVIGRDQWHYEKVVYNHQIHGNVDPKSELIDAKASAEFKDILQKSIFSLCPSGSGPNSIRLWESIGFGTIPVIISDRYLPPGDLDLWKQAAVFCDENESAIRSLPDKLEVIANDPILLNNKRQAMRQLWKIYGPECFVYDIQKLLLSPVESLGNQNLHWKDSSIDYMINAVINSKGRNLKFAGLLVQACASRIMCSPDYFIARYQRDARLKEALKLARKFAPEKILEQFRAVSKLKNLSIEI